MRSDFCRSVSLILLITFSWLCFSQTGLASSDFGATGICECLAKEEALFVHTLPPQFFSSMEECHAEEFDLDCRTSCQGKLSSWYIGLGVSATFDKGQYLWICVPFDEPNAAVKKALEQGVPRPVYQPPVPLRLHLSKKNMMEIGMGLAAASIIAQIISRIALIPAAILCPVIVHPDTQKGPCANRTITGDDFSCFRFSKSETLCEGPGHQQFRIMQMSDGFEIEPI